MTINIEKLAVECGGLCARGTVILELSELQAFAEACAEQENYNLLGVIADIRMALGVNEKPMLSELANVAKEVKAENEALKTILAEYEKPMMEHGDSVYRKPVKLEDFTLPPVNLESLGRAK